VRADKVPTEATAKDVLKLKERIAELERELEQESSGPARGTENLLQGEETFTVDMAFTSRLEDVDGLLFGQDHDEDMLYDDPSIDVSWDDIFGAIAPSMIDECSDGEVRQLLQNFFIERARAGFKNDKEFESRKLINFKFRTGTFDTVIVQLRALQLIEQSVKERSVKDRKTYWKLTKRGDELMVKLRALRRSFDFGAVVSESIAVTDTVKAELSSFDQIPPVE
jgi:hypothetical protein